MLPEEDRAHLRGELERLYAARLEREGPAAANRWLRRQVIAFVPAAAGRTLGSGGDVLAAAWVDLRRTARSLLRAPMLTVVVILTLGMGIGAGALVFTVVDGVLLRPLPFTRPQELVDVWGAMSRGELAEIRRRSHTLADARGYFDLGAGVNLEHQGEAYRLATTHVEPGLFDLLGAKPLLGRLFTPEEAEPGRTQVTILGEALWRSMFAADPGVVGSTITLDGRPYRVVGVLPASWSFPDPADRLWIPLDWDPSQAGPFWGSGGVRVVGRLAPGATAVSAQAELRGFAQDISAANPVWTPGPDYRAQAAVTPLRQALVGNVRTTLLVLLGAVAVVLLVVCANVSSLLVARALERGRMVAVRTALGASRGRVAWEALLESGVLGVAGAALGVAAARIGLGLMRPALVGRMPRAGELVVDGRVLALSIVAGVGVGLVAGILPAVRAARRHPAAALRFGGRGGGPGARRRALSGVLVGGQVAAAVVLVTSAFLLVRTLAALSSVEPGFRTDGLLTVDVTFPSTYDEGAIAPAYDALLGRVGSVAGVRGAALAGTIPFGDRREVYATYIEGVTKDPNQLPSISADRVTVSYFDVMGIPLLEGRGFTRADREGGPLVAVVDERMARRFWPGTSPVGRRIRYPWAGAPWIEIVGVVGSVADRDLAAARQPRWYVPLAQRPSPDVTLVVASTLPGSMVLPAVRRAVTEVDTRLPLSHPAPYGDLLGESAARTRLTARVLLVFALATLFLGCLGVYGLSAHRVRERRREIGVRMALGARATTVGADVVREGLRVAGPGALVGVAVAGATTRLLAGMLYGVTPLDPLTFVAVPLLMLAAAVAAVWIPARRAARVDPMESLREG